MFNMDRFPENVPPSDKTHKTVPDQSMSVREMIRRHQKGLPVLGAKVPLYMTEDEMALGLPDLTKLDRADQEMILQGYTVKLTEMKLEMEKKTALLRQQKLDEHIEKLVEERIAARRSESEHGFRNPDRGDQSLPSPRTQKA